MLMPSIFGENLFDDWFDEFPFYDMDKEIRRSKDAPSPSAFPRCKM